MRNAIQVLFSSIFLLLTCNAIAQLNFFPLNADFATFAGNPGKTYTEVYLSIYQNDLTYQNEDSSTTAHFAHTIKIFQDDSLIQQTERHYKNTLNAENQSNTNNQFMDVFAFELDPGEYDLVALISDDISQKKGEYSLALEIPEYGQEFMVSDIQLSTKINKTDVASNFSNKNNLEIYPNPSRTFGLSQPILYFYFELYNLHLDKDSNNHYSYHYSISDLDGRRVRDFPEKIKSSTSKTAAEAAGTNIITLASNDYYLNFEIKDMQSGSKSLVRKKFRIYKPTMQSSNAQEKARLEGYEEYMNYTKDQLVDEFQKVSYIATRQEQDIFNGITEIDGMKKFIAEFWKRRDPDPANSVNKYKKTYFENLQFANTNFESSFKEGWRTDQGRVILIYGKPDEIDRHPSSINSVPYQIWYYYSLEGGAHFVFADETGHGNFELIHSNYRNEIKDPNWRQRIGAEQTDFDMGGGFNNY